MDRFPGDPPSASDYVPVAEAPGLQPGFFAAVGCACCAPALPALAAGRSNALMPGAPSLPALDQLPRLFLNARVLTMDPDDRETDGLLIQGERILAAGSGAELDAAAAPGTRRIDCAGRILLPGFIEPHMHLSPIAALASHEDVGPFRFPKVADALAHLGRLAGGLAEGTWVLGRQFDPSLQKGPAELTTLALDPVVPDRPAFIYNASLHFAYCNSAALALAGITADTPDPPGAHIGRYPDGTPNGVLKGGAAMALVSRHNPRGAVENLADACLGVFRKANEVGFTTLCDQGTGAMNGVRDLELYRNLNASGALTGRLRYSLFNTLAERWDATDVAFGQGNEWIRAAGWKIVSDGSNQGRSGLQRTPYPGTSQSGLAYIEPDVLRQAVDRRLREGWPVVVHANGDLAIDRALDAFEAAAAAGLDVAGQRCRLEHCSILHDEQIQRIAALGLSPSFLIGHVHWWGKAFRDEIFGPEKAALLDRTAACEAAGIRWTLHSDEPVTEMGPLRCIENAVTRRLWRTADEVLAPAERVSVAAALRAMTRDAAWQCHSDHEIGTLEPGKLADFIMLEDDPRRVAPEAIGSIRVLETWVGGRQVYAR